MLATKSFPGATTMNVFISWSGDRSHAVASLLREWLQCVLQAVNPWISSLDIDRGALWFGEINKQLSDTAVGIVCLTQENKERPWILFEAGALAKGLSKARVCTLLIDLSSTDVRDPLGQFNHTRPTREDMLKLISTLNGALASPLQSDVLTRSFNAHWGYFESRFAGILTEFPAEAPPSQRDERDMLEEMLRIVRSIANSTSTKASQFETPDYVKSYFADNVKKQLMAPAIEKDEVRSLIQELGEDRALDWLMRKYPALGRSVLERVIDAIAMDSKR